MAVEDIGMPNIEHVAQPAESELCFAAIISAVSGASVPEAHAALVAAGLSGADGSTYPMGDEELKVVGSVVVIKPFQSPFEGASDTGGVMELMDEQFANGDAVTLLHKKNSDPSDERHHWTLFSGYSVFDGEKGPLRTIDPLLARATYFRREKVAEMIDRSMDFAGVYGFALNTREP